MSQDYVLTHLLFFGFFLISDRNVFDWLCYILLLASIITHVADVIAHSDLLARWHIRIIAVTIILLWLRLMKNARAFERLGKTQ